MGNMLVDMFFCDSIAFSKRLAAKIGLNESIFIQQVHYWLQRTENIKDGYRWVYNSAAQWHEQLPFFSEPTIKRIIKSLKEKNLIVISSYNKKSFDRTNWYRIDYEELERLLAEIVDSEREDQNDTIESTNSDPIESIKMIQSERINLIRPIPKNTTKNTTENNQSIYREEEEKPEEVTDGLIDEQPTFESIVSDTVEQIKGMLCLDDSQDYENFRGMMPSDVFENYKEIPDILAQMICDKQPKTYNGCYVSHGEKVMDRVRHVLSKDSQHNLVAYGIRASKNFLNACITKPPKNPVAYFKSVLWSALSNYTLEDNAEFMRTYYSD